MTWDIVQKIFPEMRNGKELVLLSFSFAEKKPDNSSLIVPGIFSLSALASSKRQLSFQNIVSFLENLNPI